MTLVAIPKPILFIAGIFALNAAVGLWSLSDAGERSFTFYGTNLILIIVFGLVPALGLLLGWKIAHIIVLVYGAAAIVSGAGSAVLNLGLVIVVEASWDRHVWLQLAFSVALFVLGLVLYRYFRNENIAKIYRK